MAISALINYLDDVGKPLINLIRGQVSKGIEPLPFTRGGEAALIDAIHNPRSEASAVARMNKLHYGSFYKSLPKDIMVGPLAEGAALQYRTPMSGMAERELLSKGKGWGGAVFGRPVKGLGIGISHFKGALLFAPLQAVSGAAFAPRRHKMSSFFGGAAKAVAFGVGDLVGSTLGGPLAGLALGIATEPLGGIVEEGVQLFNDVNRSIKHVNMGGNYEDTGVAYTMRQRAAQELGSSVLNARQWLGKEAQLMHQ